MRIVILSVRREGRYTRSCSYKLSIQQLKLTTPDKFSPCMHTAQGAFSCRCPWTEESNAHRALDCTFHARIVSVTHAPWIMKLSGHRCNDPWRRNVPTRAISSQRWIAARVGLESTSLQIRYISISGWRTSIMIAHRSLLYLSRTMCQCDFSKFCNHHAIARVVRDLQSAATYITWWRFAAWWRCFLDNWPRLQSAQYLVGYLHDHDSKLQVTGLAGLVYLEWDCYC